MKSPKDLNTSTEMKTKIHILCKYGLILFLAVLTGCATKPCQSCAFKDDMLDFYEAELDGTTNSRIHQEFEQVYKLRQKLRGNL